ncbi:MAG: hypothetical protein ACI30R_09520 [Sodaliphilus sp.]
MGKKLAFMCLLVVSSLTASAQLFSGGGDGSLENPYKLTKSSDIDSICIYVNALAVAYDGKYFQMLNDITLEGTGCYNIGRSNCSFKGNFDGCGHSFKGINVTVSGSEFAIFNYLGPTGTIKNLTIDSPSVTYGSGSVYNGLLVGHLQGVIDNCHVKNASLNMTACAANKTLGGMVNYVEHSGTLKNSSFSGRIDASCNVGSLVGSNYGTVENCESSAEIYSTRDNSSLVYIGGIGGKLHTGKYVGCTFKGYIKGLKQNYIAGIVPNTNTGSIEGCVNEGKLVGIGYVGGIASYTFNNTSVTDCYNVGTVTDTFMDRDSIVNYTMSDFVAGIVAYQYGCNVERCWNGGTIKSIQRAGGIVGASQSGAVKDCYNAGLIYAPYSNEVSGLVATKQNAVNIYCNIENCLSWGTVYNAVTARFNGAEFCGKENSINQLGVTVANSYFDIATAGTGVTTTGAKTTAELTSGTPIENFDTEVWTFEAGKYPRLTKSASTAAAKASAEPFFLAPNNRASKVTENFEIGPNATWSIGDAKQVVLNNTVATVTRSSIKEDVTLTATVESVSRESIISIYPQIFEGAGTESDPYLIQSFNDMKSLSDATNAQSLCFDGEYFKVTNDIDMLNDDSFSPISASQYFPFSGTFDGCNHTIKNWTITMGSTAKGGLFSYIGKTGKLSNLTIDKSCSLSGAKEFAPFVSQLAGSIDNCRNRADASSAAGYIAGVVNTATATASITNCYNQGTISATGTAGYVAGIVCTNNGVVEFCQNSGAVNCPTGSTVGGIAAYSTAQGQIKSCISAGAVSGNYNVGGLVGNQLGKVSSCLSYAPVTYVSNVDYAGAVFGKYSAVDSLYSNIVYDRQIGIYNNIKHLGIYGALTSEIVGLNYDTSMYSHAEGQYPVFKAFAEETGAVVTAIPIVFADNETRLTMSTTAQVPVISGVTYKLDDADDFKVSAAGVLTYLGSSAFTYDELTTTCNGFSKSLRISAYGDILDGSGTADDPWLISAPEHLVKLSNQVSASKLSYEGKVFKFTADLDMSGIAFNSIVNATNSKFCGTILGEGHSISNLSISKSANTYVGLIGYLGEKGVVKDLTIASGEISGSQYVGAFAGIAAGTLESCINYANVNSAKGIVGGFVGVADNTAKLNNLTNHGNVTASNTKAGGIIGDASGNGSQTFTHLYNHGTITATMWMGGIAGNANACDFDYVGNYGDIVGTAKTSNQNGGIVGYLTESHKVAHAFNFGRVNGNTGIAGIVARCKNASDTLVVSDSYNAAPISGATASIGGIVGMAEATPLKVIGCANTDSISNTSTSTAATLAGAGGIVGSGVPTISDCFNAGVISAKNGVGTILGYSFNLTSPYSISNTLNTGRIDGYAETATNVGAIVGKKSSQATYTNVITDAQLCFATADAEGVTALPTAEIATGESILGENWTAQEGRYPILKSLEADTAVAVCTLPVFLASGETYNAVQSLFKVATDDHYTWTSSNPLLAVVGENVVPNKEMAAGESLSIEGDATFTVSCNDYAHSYPLNVNIEYIATGVNSIENGGSKILPALGGVILSGGKYAVYDLAGRLVKNGCADLNQPIALPAGVYIVVTPGATAKVMVK